jgi:hypothetical protein
VTLALDFEELGRVLRFRRRKAMQIEECRCCGRGLAF